MRPPEMCDDGNRTDGIGCSPNCLSALPTWVCSGGGYTSVDRCTPRQGDGFSVGSE